MALYEDFLSNWRKIVSEMHFDKAQTLQAAAEGYLRVVNKTKEDIEALETALRAAAALRNQIREDLQNPNATYKQFMQNKAYQELDEQRTNFLKGESVKQLYDATFKFQKILNAVLGQTSIMVYVATENNKPQILQVEEMDLISFGATSSYKLTGRFSPTKAQLSKLKDKMKIINPFEFEGADTDRLKGLQATYNEVIRRFSLARVIKSDMVLWNIGNEWYGMRVIGGEGDIKEAYVSFALLNNELPTFQEEVEINVKDYMTDTVSGVGVVDNASGLLQGDISLGNGLEYAVKSVGASTLGLTQVIDLANEIIAEGGKYTVEELQKKKQALDSEKVCRDLLHNAEMNERRDGLREIAQSLPADSPLGGALRSSIQNSTSKTQFRQQLKTQGLIKK